MAGLRIRWRREGSGLNPPAAATDIITPSLVRPGVYVWVAAAAILLLALTLRVYNVNWDDGQHLHPDERHISIVANAIELPGSVSEYFDTGRSSLNPYNGEGSGSFVYGTLPLFLSKAIASLLGKDSYEELVLVGRHLSALFDAATVLLVFLIGRRLFGGAAGLIGASLFATAPLAIQQAHFLVVDPFLTFFTTAILYFAVLIAQEGRMPNYALAGLMLGLGLACKVTAILVAPVVLAAVALQLWQASRPILTRHGGLRAALEDLRVQRVLQGALLFLIVGFLAFRVAQPYAFDAPSLGNLGAGLNQRWLDDQRSQNDLLGGDIPFPPSVQWIDRESYLFPLQQMLTWGMGPAFGIAGWAGFAYAAYRLVRWREARWLLPVLFVAVYFGFMGRQFSLYLRYFLPLYPVLAVLAGAMLAALISNATRLAQRKVEQHPSLQGRGMSRARWPQTAGYGLAGVILIGGLLAGLAYAAIYTRPVTRVEASAWMYANLLDGSRIAGEHWDDPAPLRLPGTPDKGFQLSELPLYELDTPTKVANLIAGLDRADYVVLSSNRLINSIPRNPYNYPVTSRYYDLLLDEQLGFRLLREFTSYPGLLGIEVADHGTEESWSSYDHPRVLLFEKTLEYSSQRVTTLLDQGPLPLSGLTPAQADRNGLLLSTSDLTTQREGGTWTSVFSDSGLARSQPTLLWFGALQIAALAVTPLALLLFRRLPDRGYLLAKPLGLLLLAYPVWLLASLKVVSFDQTAILGVLVLLVLVGSAMAIARSGEMTSFFRGNWPLVLVSEALFLGAFLLFRELRLENPDLWHPFRGGEKPMDLAFLTAVTRSTTLPPYDPWLAGGYINYYYLGQFFTATLSKLTAIPPEVAFNLAVPTFFSLTVAGVFSVCYNLASAARGFVRRLGGIRRPPRWSAYAAGLLGVFLVTIAGNLDGIDQLAERLAAVSSWHLDTPAPLLDAVVNGFGGLWQVIFHGANLQDFDYWRSSRMLPPTISITEFPYFSFLFADLHAHMMAIPFQVLALGLSLSLALGRRGDWREWGVVALLGLVVGSLRWLNSWDYPTFLLVALAVLVINERRLEGGLSAAAPRFLAKAVLLVSLSLLLFKPFLDSYQTPVSGLQESPETTPLHQYLAHFGVFAAILGAWLAYALLRTLRPHLRGLAGTSRRDSGLMSRPAERALTFASSAIAVLLAALLALVLGYGLIAALLPVLAVVAYLAWRELRSPRPDAGPRLFVLMLIGLGLGLSMGVELVTINGDIQRMNTVFKFYLHTWVVFAIAATFTAWQLLFVLWRPSLAGMAPRLPRYAARAGAAGLAALVLAAFAYPIFATPVRIDDRFADLPRSLDGMEYMRTAVYSDARAPMDLAADYEGIQWLRQNVEGTPAIVEGRTDLYRWGSRFSIYTGLPTVLGWDWHEKQQRGELAFMIDERAAQVEAFYANPEQGQARRFLQRYNVEYVILGQLERAYYPIEGLRKFESGLGGALEIAYSNPGLTIYRVKPAALGLGSASP
ncbi:MAG: phospholipid carrier-dependent glycosyltransferase [Dehalococcoidia bacterium]|nr:phospholipid carrier-dependent glycosyltransferase [Dehalococcoidia bacterium]